MSRITCCGIAVITLLVTVTPVLSGEAAPYFRQDAGATTPFAPAASDQLTSEPRRLKGIEGTDVSTSDQYTDDGGDGCTPDSKEEHC